MQLSLNPLRTTQEKRCKKPYACARIEEPKPSHSKPFKLLDVSVLAVFSEIKPSKNRETS